MRKLILLSIALALALSLYVFGPAAKADRKPSLKLSDLKQMVQLKSIDPGLASLNGARKVLSGAGEKKVLVVPYFFEDVKYTYMKESLAEKFVRGKEKSLANYYHDASGGRMQITFGSKGIPDWIKMPKPYSVYQSLEEIVHDGFAALRKLGYNLTEYDEDGNGQPDLVTFVSAGNSWAVGGDMPGAFTAPMENLGWYIFIGEDVRVGFPLITIIHEFAHQCIPLWDTYDYSGSGVPVGAWDLMADGVWNGYCGLPAFQRWQAGWFDPITITEPGTYYIDDLNGEGPNKMLKIPIPGSPDEWFCLENRSRKGSDGYFQGAPESGLVIYHIDDKRGYKHLFNSLFTMDGISWRNYGIMVLDPSGSNLHVGAIYGADRGRTKVTPFTIPNTLPYRKTESDKSIHITEISARGPRMSFKVDFLAPEKPVVSVDSQVFYGRIVKGRSATREINFKNSGIGRLFIQMKSSEPYLQLDRNNFIGNDETINATIDTTNLKIGKHTVRINYSNQSSDAVGYIECFFEVVPIEGDLNADGRVEPKEIEEFMKLYGLKAGDDGFKIEYDFNTDGVVDITDLMMLAKNYRHE